MPATGGGARVVPQCPIAGDANGGNAAGEGIVRQWLETDRNSVSVAVLAPKLTSKKCSFSSVSVTVPSPRGVGRN